MIKLNLSDNDATGDDCDPSTEIIVQYMLPICSSSMTVSQQVEARMMTT